MYFFQEDFLREEESRKSSESLEQSLELVKGDLAIATVVQRVNDRIDFGFVHMSAYLVQESLEFLGLYVT